MNNHGMATCESLKIMVLIKVKNAVLHLLCTSKDSLILYTLYNHCTAGLMFIIKHKQTILVLIKKIN